MNKMKHKLSVRKGGQRENNQEKNSDTETGEKSMYDDEKLYFHSCW